MDHLQAVVLGEAAEEVVGHRLQFVEAGGHIHAFLAEMQAGSDVGGVAHAMVGAESRHDAAQAFSPVAGAEFLPLQRQTDDDEVFWVLL